MVFNKWRARRSSAKDLKSREEELRQAYEHMRAIERQNHLPTYDSINQDSHQEKHETSDYRPLTARMTEVTPSHVAWIWHEGRTVVLGMHVGYIGIHRWLDGCGCFLEASAWGTGSTEQLRPEAVGGRLDGGLRLRKRCVALDIYKALPLLRCLEDWCLESF